METASISAPGVADPVQPRAASDGAEIERAVSHLRLEKAAEVPLQLQRRASINLRHHVQRALTRFVVLVACDLTVFALMREAIRWARDGADPSNALGEVVRSALPGGYLNGWQFAVALFIGLLVTGSYGTGDRRRDVGRLFAACALAAALPLWTAAWARGLEPVLVHYGVTVLAVWAAVVVERLAIDHIVARVRPRPASADTVFVGPADECARVATSPAFAKDGEFRAVGFVDVQNPPAPGALGHVGEFALLLAASGAEAVVVCGQLSEGQFRTVVEGALAGGCQLMSVSRAVETTGIHPSLVWRQGQAVMQLLAPSLQGQQLLVKRVLDVVGASLLLILLAPVMALVALAITLDSRGGVLFGQERVGSGGNRFRVMKFRTMYDGVPDTAHRELVTKMLQGDDGRGGAQAGPEGERVFKLVNDQRVTRVGRWLRRASLDELPQLLNVLRGDMSLVGPRPPLPYELDQYEHWQLHRLQMRPGITGLWQVSGRNRLTYRQMCELDLAYIRDWSLWLDLSILFKTVPVVLLNSGRAS